MSRWLSRIGTFEHSSNSWCLWEYLWDVAAPGDYRLLSRAISANGQIQPARHNLLHGGYLISFSRPIDVRVDATRRSADLARDHQSLHHEMNALAEEWSRLRLDVEMGLTSGEGI